MQPRAFRRLFGALALSAVFSTEVDTCDAVLFMLSTTLSQDLYKRHLNPRASDRQLLRVARAAAVARRHRERIAQPERVELVDRALVLGVLHFVRDQEHGAPGLAHDVGDLGVLRQEPSAPVHDEDQ